MLILTVTSSCSHQKPAILFEHPDHISNFLRPTLAFVTESVNPFEFSRSGGSVGGQQWYRRRRTQEEPGRTQPCSVEAACADWREIPAPSRKARSPGAHSQARRSTREYMRACPRAARGSAKILCEAD